MRFSPALFARHLTRLLAASLLLVSAPLSAQAINAAPASDARPVTSVVFLTDRAIDAMAAPFAVALEDGLFRNRALAVSIKAATGSTDAIARVANGTAHIALADLNALIRYRDGRDAVPVKAVYVYQLKAPYAIITRKSRGVSTLESTAGKTIGAIEGDLSFQMWPALAKRNNIKPASLKVQRVGASVREPMLSSGQIDAITGFSYLSPISLRNRGIPAADLDIFRFADYGLAAYGTAIIVNPEFASQKPDAVRAFLAAVQAGTDMTLTRPGHAVDAVLKLMPTGSRELETERLRAIIADQLLATPNGSGDPGRIDQGRFLQSVDEMSEGFTFRSRPKLADIFDDQFLPDATNRPVD